MKYVMIKDQTFTIMQAACLLRFGGITKISIPKFYEMEQRKQDHLRHFILTVEMKDQEKMTRQKQSRYDKVWRN